MKKFLLCMIAVLLAPASHAYASDVGFSIGINFGYPGVATPAYVPQPVVIEEPPEFVNPPELGFYVAAGVPYDLFYVDSAYYLCRGNVWYTSPYYNGPWQTVYYNKVPYALHRYPFARIHQYRDAYFRRHLDYGDGRGYRHFQPGWRGTDRDGHGWGRPAYNAPNRPSQNNWNRPAFNTPTRPDQGNWNRPAYNAPNRQDRGNWSRSVNNTPGRPNQDNWNRPVYKAPTRPDQGNWNRPAYNAPNRQERRNWGVSADNTPGRPNPGNVSRPASFNPNRHEQGNWGSEGRGRQ